MTAIRLTSSPMVGTTVLNQPGLALRMVFSGRQYGYTLLTDTFLENLSGTQIGSTTLSNPVLRLRKHLGGQLSGETLLGVCLPLRMVGVTGLSAHMKIARIKPYSCVCSTPRMFRWEHPFTKNDLTLSIRDGLNAASPYEVWYTLYQVQASGARVLLGPKRHTPVTQGTGEYYVSGYAGRGGQPGQFQLEWNYRKSFNGPVHTEVIDFQVVDAVLKPIPGDVACRVNKYGWNE